MTSSTIEHRTGNGHHGSRRTSQGRCQVLLFPGCDPRGVLMRALSRTAPKWSTRTDALIFGWTLALSPGASRPAAARAVRDVLDANGPRRWSESQRELLASLERIEREG